jgi:cytochrome c biogenesis protein CcdA/glutaredoxin
LGKERIPIIYFSTPGCEECEIARNYLEALKEIYPEIEVREFSLSDDKNKELLAHFNKEYNVPENKRNIAPTAFIGEKFLTREEITKKLEGIVKSYNAEKTEFIEKVLETNSGGSNYIIELFQKFGVLTILGAGFIDGYNPCAFAVLIFFISFLLLRGKTKKNILSVGLSFIFGFGLSYFLLGIGLFKIVSEWRYFNEIAKWVYLATAIITLVLAIITIGDYIKAKKGHLKDMALQLSRTEKRTIHSLLRNPKVQGIAIFSFLVAFPVSIVSFSCTGQTYLPTIVYIYSIPAFKAKATLYLILYNLMFILPLVVVVYIVYMGTTSEKITEWFTNRIAAIKLWTGIVFIVLFLYLINRTLLLFNIIR